MALIISDRVKETTTTQGTGSLTLSGATFGGFQTFSSAIGNGNTTYYCIQNESNFEIGIGTFSSGSLSRDTVLQSSNSDSKISLSGASTVFCVIPADRIVYKDTDNAVVFPTPFVFKRSDDGDYWQAYSTDYGTRVVSMFMSEGFDPEWKIGLKTSSSDSVEPTYGYISGKDGFIELKGSSQSILNLGSSTSEGFKVSHRLTTIIHLKENGGEIFVDSLNIKNADISQDVLSVEAGVGHVANLQTWNVSTSEKASIDAEGNFNTVGNISGVTGVFSAINFADGTIQTSAALPSSSGYLIDQNALDIITVSGIAAAGGGGDVTTEQLNYVSGIAVYGSGQAVANQADILAVSGWAESYVDSQDHSAVLVSGWARDYVDSQDHSAAAVSGWALETFLTSDDDSYVSGVAAFASGQALTNKSNISTNTSNISTNSSNIVAVSGWARDYVDAQDHSAIAVSGWARDYVDSQDHSAASVSGALQPQITQNAQDIVTVSGLLASSTQTFDSDITVSLGGGKTFGRYEDGDTIPASGKTANEVISLAITEPIAPTASLTSSSSVDFNQTAVSITLNFSHTINSLGASVSSASLEFRRGNTGSWTVLSTSTSASSSYTHTFTDTANNTSQLNYRYTVTDSASATTTVTKNINPDTYSSPSISLSVVADSTTSPETNSSRERGNVASTISGTISSNETYIDLVSYTLQYSVDGGSWTTIGSTQSISGQSATISSTAHNPTSDNTASSIRYRVVVVDDYQTNNSSISTISFGLLKFYGPTSSVPTTSSAVRSLPTRAFTSSADIFTLNTGTSEVNFTVAIPSDESISQVMDLEVNANVTSQYVNNTFNVDDAGGTAVSYNVYTMTIAQAYSSNHRHQVTKG